MKWSGNTKMMIKNILHKWHWFWFKIHTRWLIKEYEADVEKAIYDAFKKMLEETTSEYSYIKCEPKRLTDEMIKRVNNDMKDV